MNRSNCTNLKWFEGGRVVKQGDSASLFGFALYDENWVPIDLDGQEAIIHFVSKKGKASFSTTVQGSKVTFKIPKVLPSADEYTSEQVLELVKNDVKAEIGKFIEAHKESGITEEFPDLTTLYNLAKI